MKRIAVGLGVFALLGVSACSSSSDKKSVADAGPGAGGSHGTGGSPSASGGGSADAATGFKLTWGFADGSVLPPDSGVPDAGFTSPPLSGVKVCVDQHPEIACVTSDANGNFTLLGVPPRTNLVLTCEKAGYVNASKSVQTSSTDVQESAPIDMFANHASPADTPPAGVTLDGTKGSVLFFALGPVPGSADPNAFGLLAGVSVTLSPAAGKGPYFFGVGDKKPDLSLTKTLGGAGLYYNVDPGDYTLTFDDPDYDCAAIGGGFGGWGVPAPPNGVKFTVLAGHMVDEMGVFCTTKSVIVGGDGG
jgi:hypothetical protein